jgi:hypothetical protein
MLSSRKGMFHKNYNKTWQHTAARIPACFIRGFNIKILLLHNYSPFNPFFNVERVRKGTTRDVIIETSNNFCFCGWAHNSISKGKVCYLLSAHFPLASLFDSLILYVCRLFLFDFYLSISGWLFSLTLIVLFSSNRSILNTNTSMFD